jgi:hypothetical protein
MPGQKYEGEKCKKSTTGNGNEQYRIIPNNAKSGELCDVPEVSGI